MQASEGISSGRGEESSDDYCTLYGTAAIFPRRHHEQADIVLGLVM